MSRKSDFAGFPGGTLRGVKPGCGEKDSTCSSDLQMTVSKGLPAFNGIRNSDMI